MKRDLTLGSLFDGSGGFPLGGLLAGITPIWASEIEPFPIRVTSKRIPTMKHLGDISRIRGDTVEPVSIITFGSPCTDMSVAGKRAGLGGSQSVLFYEAIRIIKEMRAATNGEYPRYCVWENVPGAFSSNRGNDFKAVLEAIIGVVAPGTTVPLPEKSRWPYADSYMGDGWSVAYRTLDAQYWGVPQRRKRIYLVADFNDTSAWKVLFKSEGVSGYSAESFRAWQRASGNAEGGSAAASLCLNDQGGSVLGVTEHRTATLRATANHPPCVIDNIVSLENHPQDSRIGLSKDNTVQTLASQMGKGGNNVPLVLKVRSGCEGGGKGALIQEDKSATLSCNNDQTLFEPCSWNGDQTSPTLTANNAGGNQRMPDKENFNCVIDPAICIQGSVIGREVENGPNGKGVTEDVAYTLNTVDRHAVYATTTGCFVQTEEDKTPTLTARDYKDPQAVCYGIGRDAFNQGQNASYKPAIQEELQPTLMAKGPGAVAQPGNNYSVRRLTPTECARLQGFPDWWCSSLETDSPSESEIAMWREIFETHRRITAPDKKPKTDKQIVKWLKKPYSDSAEYKMWGNGVALPCVFFVLAGIVYCHMRSEPDMSYERIIEYLEAIKLEYPGGEVCDACDIVIEKLKKELEQTE